MPTENEGDKNKVTLRKKTSASFSISKKSIGIWVHFIKNQLFRSTSIIRPTSLNLKQKNTQQAELTVSPIKEYRRGKSIDFSHDLEKNPLEIDTKKVGEPEKQGTQSHIIFFKLTNNKKKRWLLTIEKKGGSSIKNEIYIFKTINENENFINVKVKNLFSVPFHSEIKESINIIYSRLQINGDLKRHVHYIHTQLENKDLDSLHYLFTQFHRLILALKFLHNESFKDENGILHRGIVHGDIKPGNILLNSQAALILSDFGCAHFFDQPVKEIGTVSYVAPELYYYDHNNAYENIGRSDIWSLGFILYCLLTKQDPVEKISTEIKNLTKKSITVPTGYTQAPRVEIKQSDLVQGNSSKVLLAQWGKDYSKSNLCKDAKSAKNYLTTQLGNTPNPTSDSYLFKRNLLLKFSLMMLLPVEERPSAEELIQIMKKLSQHFDLNKNLDPFISNILHQVPPVYIETTSSKSLYKTL